MAVIDVMVSSNPFHKPESLSRRGLNTATAVVIVFGILSGGILAMSNTNDRETHPRGESSPAPQSSESERATFGAGCFWCTEAVFQQLKGVQSVVSGYSGGPVKNPTYEQVCSGTTGHAEVIQVTFDPKAISFAELLEVFWQTHDPTTLNRQGHDVGTQYRSAIFYHNDEQRTLAEKYKRELEASGAFHAPIVTEITAYSKFFPAEGYHQNYFVDNPRQPYCTAVIRPKVEKFKKVFHNKLKAAPPPS